MSAPAGPVWPLLRSAAEAFCPPYEFESKQPGRLSLTLREAETGDEIRLRYRSVRGLVLRTYYLVVEADVVGEGPAKAGELAYRWRKLAWRRPKPPDAKRWRDRLGSADVRAALGRLQIETLTLAWEPERATWRVRLETLSGSVTATFFPPLLTPNPFKREEAAALAELLRALRRASARTPV